MTRGGRARAGRVLGDSAMGLIAFLMLAPVAVIVVLSFSTDPSLIFPPEQWGFTRYTDFLGSSYWTGALWKSVEIGIPAAALATVVGVPAAIAVERTRLPGRELLVVAGMAPLILPGIAYAVALYAFYADAQLLGTVPGVVLGHAMLSLPFVIVIVVAGLRRTPKELELVAMSLGASRARATWGITIRLLVPSITAAFLLSFITSFEEGVLVNFLGGSDSITLPKAIYDSLRTGVEPLITAIAVVLMVGTGVLALLIRLLRARIEAGSDSRRGVTAG